MFKLRINIISILFITAIVSQSINASSEKDRDYQFNCQKLQKAFARAIDLRQSGHTDIEIAIAVRNRFPKEQLIACSRDYDESHPDDSIKFKETKDGYHTRIRVFVGNEADEYWIARKG